MKHYVNENLINNCNITADDINRAELVYGPAVPYIQGHMTRKRPLVHNKVEKIPLPPMIAKHHTNIALYMDFFYVNGNIFFVSRSGKVDFFTSQYCTSRSLKTIMTVLDSIINKYHGRSFRIIDYHGDNEFNKAALKDFCNQDLCMLTEEMNTLGPLKGQCAP